MSFEPLLTAPPVIQTHAYAAGAAFILGLVQLFGPKGTRFHIAAGTLWVILMTVIAGTSIFITHPVKPGDPFWARYSPIHLFTVATILSLALGLWLIARGGPGFKMHARPFTGVFLGGLVVAGALAFLPGRIMHQVAFGN